MNKIKIICIGIILLMSSVIHAQVSVNINVGSAPDWGPAGYSDVRYYYLPDVEAYYDVQTAMFIYYGGGTWLHRKYLPSYYRNYDLYSGYKVVMVDYHGNAPYHNFSHYKSKYAKGYKGNPQKTIGSKSGRGNSGGHKSKESFQGKREFRKENTKSVAPSNNKGSNGNQIKNSNKNGHEGGRGKKK